MTPTRCLVDTDVWSDALHLEHRDQGLELMWWGNEWITVHRKQQWLPPVPPETHAQKRQDWLALPNLGKLFQSGVLVPAISDAIEIELDTTPYSDTTDFFGFEIGTAQKLDTGLRRAAWAECLGDLRRPQKQDAIDALSRVKDERLDRLVQILGEKHVWDTIHIWTAEKEGIPLFVSMDRKFRNQFENGRRHHKSAVEIASPSELVSRHGQALAEISEVLQIRDIFRQQRLRPMCQFRWPKNWAKRLWCLLTKKIEMHPLQGRLEIPDQTELRIALVELELRELGLAASKISNAN